MDSSDLVTMDRYEYMLGGCQRVRRVSGALDAVAADGHTLTPATHATHPGSATFNLERKSMPFGTGFYYVGLAAYASGDGLAR